MIGAARWLGLAYGSDSLLKVADLLSAEVATVRLEGGEVSLAEAIPQVGSSLRLEWVIEMQARGYLSRDDLLAMLPDLWRGSDPDDEEPRFLALWREAWQRNGQRTIVDGPPLPRGAWLSVYRGEMGTSPASSPLPPTKGMAWTLDRGIAARFAGAASLVPVAGSVRVGKVRRSKVLAYLTGRGESEVILNPADVVPGPG